MERRRPAGNDDRVVKNKTTKIPNKCAKNKKTPKWSAGIPAGIDDKVVKKQHPKPQTKQSVSEMPLDCEQIRNEFSALLDDELNPEDRELVEEHLSDCSDCLRELHGYQQVSDSYRYHHPVKAPADFEALLRERMAPATRVHRLPARTWLSLAAAAAVTLTAGLVLWNKPLPDIEPFQMSQNEAESGAAPTMLENEARSFSDTNADAETTQRALGGPAQTGQFSGGGGGTPNPAAGSAPAMEALPPQESPDPSGMRLRTKDSAADTAPTAPPPPAEAPQMMQALPAPGAMADDAIAHEAATREEAMADTAEAAPAPSAPLVAMKRSMAPESEDAPESAAEVSALSAPAPEGERVAETSPADSEKILRWRERYFHLHEGVWREQGYKDQARTPVTIPSDQWNKLLDAYQDLNKLVSSDRPVVVKLGSTWYEIRRAQPKPEPNQGR